jgi:hypothetical protein
MVSVREEKTQEGKTPKKHHNTQKWASTKKGLVNKRHGMCLSKNG